MVHVLREVIGKADAAVWRLAAGQTLVWAGLYYVFPALLLKWETAQGWSRADLSFVFSSTLVMSALCAPVAGRLIDRGWGRYVMGSGALLGGVCLVGVSQVQTFSQFYALWLVIGVAMAGCLYEPCFAYLTHSRPRGAKRAITVVTLAAGFASTLSFPSANWIADTWGWRDSVMTLGAVVVLIAAPLLWSGTGAARGFRATAHKTDEVSSSGRTRRVPLHNPALWLLAVAFTSTALTHGMLISHLLPLLDERGVSPAMAVLTASLIGPMQVTGRIVMMMMDRVVPMSVVAAITFVFMTVAAITLGVTGAAMAGLVAFAVFQGSGYGVTSITKPVVTAEILGRANFGAISGALAVPYMMAYAFAPSLAAHIWAGAGYDAVVLVCIALPMVGLAAFVLATVRARVRHKT